MNDTMTTTDKPAPTLQTDDTLAKTRDLCATLVAQPDFTEIKRRIDDASRYISLDQLCLSPQCGFASTEEGNVLAEDEQWAKLRMIVEVADEVWGR